MISRTILITGASGLIGSYLTKKLTARGDKIIALSTHGQKTQKILPDIYRAVGWNDYLSLKDEKIFGIVNLAGMNLAARRWNDKVKKEIYDSRIGSTTKLIELISKMENKPEVLVSASGVDYYGDKGSKDIYEDSMPGNDFAARLCNDWEKEAMKAEDYGVRTVCLRTGFVISKDAPGLKKIILPYKFFAGGVPGSGRQFLSWIHIEDITDIYLFALGNKNMRGIYNASAPNPVTMKEFCRTIGKLLHRPSFMHVPSFIMRVLFGQVSELILSGRKAVPKKLIQTGYKFRFTEAEDALKDVLLVN